MRLRSWMELDLACGMQETGSLCLFPAHGVVFGVGKNIWLTPILSHWSIVLAVELRGNGNMNLISITKMTKIHLACNRFL